MANNVGTVAFDDGSGLILEGRYRIDLSKPLRELDRPDARAYAVDDRLGPSDETFALLCPPDTFVRHHVIEVLIERPPKRLRAPLAAQTVRLQDDKHFLAIIFNHRQARPIDGGPGRPPLAEAEVATRIIPALAALAGELQQRSITHRAIRPATILIDATGEVIVDQCVVGMPGAGQSAAFEPLASHGVAPDARGDGTIGDDVYAIGATALELVSGAAAGGDLGNDELFALKMLRGSYDALLRRRKFSTGMQSMFAGIFQDDPDKRWGAEQLQRWVTGLGEVARVATGGRRATRPFVFRDVEYSSPQLLAWAMHRHPEQALPHILSSRVEKWVRNVLMDDQAADVIRNGLNLYGAAKSGSSRDKAELLSRVILALDPTGPLRYGSLSVTASGFGAALWSAYRQNREQQLAEFADIFKSTLLDDWISLGGRLIRTGMPSSKISSLRSTLKNARRKGGGLERALYELLPRIPCMSHPLAGDMPRTPGELMQALDRQAAKGKNDGFDLDRHVAGFLATQDRSLEKGLRMLEAQSGSDAGTLVAIARFLADLQRLHYPHPVPSLTRAFAETLRPAIRELRSRVRRQVIEKKVESLAKRGNLDALLTELSLDSVIERDQAEYEAAVDEYRHLEAIIAGLSDNGPMHRLVATRRGYHYARLFSFSAAFLTGFYYTMQAML